MYKNRRSHTHNDCNTGSLSTVGDCRAEEVQHLSASITSPCEQAGRPQIFPHQFMCDDDDIPTLSFDLPSLCAAVTGLHLYTDTR